MESLQLATATSLYADATCLYQLGDLHHARDQAEEALLTLAAQTPPPPPAHVITTVNTVCNTHGEDKGPAAPPSSSSAAATASPLLSSSSALLGDSDGTDEGLAEEHTHLFGNTLLLLSAIYTAVGAYDEAERLLVTCEGYWKEHLRCAFREGERVVTVTEQRTRAKEKGENEDGGCCSAHDRALREGLAAVAYNHAVLQLEKASGTVENANCSRGAGVAEDVFYNETMQHPHSLTQNGLHPPRGNSSLLSIEAVAAEVLVTHLDKACSLLSHTLGPQRQLLADVHHTRGVCHYHLKNYVAALDAWQQALAIRVHVHRDSRLSRGKSPCGSSRKSQEAQVDELVASAQPRIVAELKVALTLEHIAHVYQLLDGRGVEALKLYDAVAAARERLLGPTHPLYFRILAAKAVLAAKLGRGKLARALLDTCHGMHGGDSKTECGVSAAKLEEMERWRSYLALPQ